MILLYIALSVYFLAVCNIVVYLFNGNKIFKILFNIFTLFGLVLNIYEFFIRWQVTKQFPSSSVYDFLLFLAIAFSITYFIIYARFKRPVVGLFIVPFSFIFSVLALFATPLETYNSVYSIWRYVHLPFIVLGSAFFVVSFLSAVMYFIQEKQLKSKHFGFVFRRFPPLDTLSNINDITLRFGFYLFTVGAAIGFVWMLQSGLNNILSSYKIILSIITWLVFVIILFIKRFVGIQPKQMAFWTIIGFLSVLITYICVAMFLVGD